MAALLLVSGLGIGALAQSMESFPDDMSLGRAGAPVTVVEYASVGCPHCAQFSVDVFPAFKAKYIDKGQVRYVYREVVTGNQTLAVGGFATARCAPADRYFQVIHDIYRQQEQLVTSGQMRSGLAAIAKSAGVTEDQFTTCLADNANIQAVAERSDRNARAGRIQGTPTLVVNGTMITTPTMEKLDEAIEAALRAK